MRDRAGIIYRRSKKPLGQSLAEYSISLSLLAVVSLGGLTLMGNNLRTTLDSFRQTMKGKAIASVATQAPISAIPASMPTPVPSTMVPSEPSAASSPDGKSCFSNGWCVDLSNASKDYHVEATGVNGSQEVILAQTDVLSQIAKLAADDPSTDPMLRTLLTKLANSGHTISDNLTTSIQTYGKNSFATAYDSFWRAQIPFDALRDQTFNYLATHPSSLPAGVETILQGATSSINTQLDSLISSTGPKASWDVLLNPAAQVASGVKTESNTICSTGGDQSLCVRL